METLEAETLREQVIEITARITRLSREAIDVYAPFTKLGIDSLMALSVVGAIEKQLKVNIPEKRLRGIKNMSDLVAVIMEGKP